MRVNLQPAFVLHQRSYRETSLLIDCLTLEYGRISLVARGIRKPRSRLRALLQPCVPLLISYQDQSELGLLFSAEADGIPIALKGQSLLAAFYLNELLMRVLHKHDPFPGIFAVYRETLQALQQGNLLQKTLRLFEKKVLTELGYGLQLQYDIAEGKGFSVEKVYRFYPEQGFECLKQNDPVSEVFIFSGKSLLAFANDTLENEESLRDAKRLMRLAFAPLIGAKPLQSRKLFIEVDTV